MLSFFSEESIIYDIHKEQEKKEGSVIKFGPILLNAEDEFRERVGFSYSCGRNYIQ